VPWRSTLSRNLSARSPPLPGEFAATGSTPAPPVAPRLDIDLDKIHHNACVLRQRLTQRGIAMTAVVKVTLGCPEIAATLLSAGVTTLADARIENIERLRRAGIAAPMTLIRSPMLSQIDRVVRHANTSLNTELDVIAALSRAARNAQLCHRIVLMVELGDLREGVLPADVPQVLHRLLNLPNIEFAGIGTNLACRSGVVPDPHNMAELSALADLVDRELRRAGRPACALVSGGNSANLHWALRQADTGRINDLRVGEALMLGCDPMDRTPIGGLHTDAFTLIAEVIESGIKPSLPRGTIAQNAAGNTVVVKDRGLVQQAILAIGRQDTEPDDLQPPPGVRMLGASSDHLIVESDAPLQVGERVAFIPGYGALLRAMTSPFVSKRLQAQVNAGAHPLLAGRSKKSSI